MCSDNSRVTCEFCAQDGDKVPDFREVLRKNSEETHDFEELYRYFYENEKNGPVLEEIIAYEKEGGMDRQVTEAILRYIRWKVYPSRRLPVRLLQRIRDWNEDPESSHLKTAADIRYWTERISETGDAFLQTAGTEVLSKKLWNHLCKVLFVDRYEPCEAEAVFLNAWRSGQGENTELQRTLLWFIRNLDLNRCSTEVLTAAIQENQEQKGDTF